MSKTRFRHPNAGRSLGFSISAGIGGRLGVAISSSTCAIAIGESLRASTTEPARPRSTAAASAMRTRTHVALAGERNDRRLPLPRWQRRRAHRAVGSDRQMSRRTSSGRTRPASIKRCCLRAFHSDYAVANPSRRPYRRRASGSVLWVRVRARVPRPRPRPRTGPRGRRPGIPRPQGPSIRCGDHARSLQRGAAVPAADPLTT